MALFDLFSRTSYSVRCARCHEPLVIEQDEIEAGKYKCPVCSAVNSIPNFVLGTYRERFARKELRRQKEKHRQEERTARLVQEQKEYDTRKERRREEKVQKAAMLKTTSEALSEALQPLVIGRTKEPEQVEGEASGRYEKAMQLGILGSVVLFLGVFMPILHLPVVGNLNYFMNGKGDGTIILVLAVVSLILVLQKRFKALWLTGFGSLALLTFTLVNILSTLSQAKADLESELAGNPFRELADIAMMSVQLQWGWGVLVGGAVLLLVAASKGGSKRG